jgi:hypothetical protein
MKGYIILFPPRHCEVRNNLYAKQSGSAYVEIVSYLAMTRFLVQFIQKIVNYHDTASTKTTYLYGLLNSYG